MMANPDAPAIVSLRPTLQNYSWGRIGHESLVAKLAKSCFSTLSYQSNGEKDKVTRTSNVVAERSIQNEEGIGNFQISPDLPYAELWMGMHPRGTSVVYSPQEPKTHHLQLDKYLAAVKAKIAPIPYLLKVLSVAKPLSIQAHPDAKKAKELFETNPDVYSDPNAKPEMTIALGYLELLCGFRKLFEIAFFIENIPELQRILGEATMKSLGITITQLSGEFVKECFSSTHDPSVLKSLFTSLLQCPNSIVQTELNHLMNRLNLLRDSNTIPQMDSRVYDACKLAQRLHSHFPGDVGVFCAFFLNFLRLEDGCGIFISANKLHAYIAGNCVECMANSDNVIRGGLTPKFKDTQLLLDILDFEPSGCTIERVIPEALDSSGILRWFHAPVERDYFQVYEIRASNPHGQVSHCFSSSCHSIGIVISTPAGVEICVNNEVHSPCQGDVLMFKPSSHFIMRRTHSEKSTASEQVVFLMYVATCGNNYSPTHGIS